MISIALLFSLRGIYKSHGLARLIAGGSLGFSISILALCVSLIVNQLQMKEIALPIMFVAGSTMYFSFHVVTYSVASPLYRMVEYPDHHLRNGMIVLYVLFRIASIVPTILGMMASGNREWNIYLAWFIVLIGIEGTALVIGILVIGYRMTSVVQVLIDLSPDSPNNQTTNNYLRKVRRMMIQLAVIGFICAFLYLYRSVQILANGHADRNYNGAIVLYLTLPLPPIILSVYATRQKAKGENPENQVQNRAQAGATANPNGQSQIQAEKEFGTLTEMAVTPLKTKREAPNHHRPEAIASSYMSSLDDLGSRSPAISDFD